MIWILNEPNAYSKKARKNMKQVKKKFLPRNKAGIRAGEDNQEDFNLVIFLKEFIKYFLCKSINFATYLAKPMRI